LLGSRRSIDAFQSQLAANPAAGVRVVGVCPLSEHKPSVSGNGDDRTSGGSSAVPAGAEPPNGHRSAASDRAGLQPHPLAVAATLDRHRAETLIVTGGLAQGRLRDLARVLEGTGVEVLVSPTPADLEDLRSEIRPVAGLPLLYLDR